MPSGLNLAQDTSPGGQLGSVQVPSLSLTPLGDLLVLGLDIGEDAIKVQVWLLSMERTTWVSLIVCYNWARSCAPGHGSVLGKEHLLFGVPSVTSPPATWMLRGTSGDLLPLPWSSKHPRAPRTLDGHLNSQSHRRLGGIQSPTIGHHFGHGVLHDQAHTVSSGPSGLEEFYLHCQDATGRIASIEHLQKHLEN